ncbi:MAG: hypothetical protein KAX38_00125, partial [Candidatus Krumholzibacteria bacterium]|nr:hypothetical protein [Candidatus Krumholzibacteria bacterium]
KFSPAREIRTLLCLNDTLWIGTEGGLFGYAVAEDTVFPVEGPVLHSIRSIEIDDSGALWVGGDGGMSIRRSSRWVHYTKGEHGSFEKIREIVHGDGKMWIGSFGNGCAYVKDDSLTVFSRRDSLLDDRVLSVVEENPYSIWFGTASGLCRADTLHWESMRYGRRIPVGAVEDIVFDEEGNLFLTVTRQGVVQYSLGRVKVFGPADGLPSREIHAFSLDPTGRVWAAGKSGLSVFEGSGWTPYRLPGVSLGRYRFLSIHHDLEGNCFLGTDEGKVLILSRDSIKEVGLPQGFPDMRVARVHLFEGSLWFLTDRRVYRLESTLVEIESPDSWYVGAMTDLAAVVGGEIWVSTRFGILHFDGGTWEVFDKRQGLPTEHFSAISCDPGGRLWFGSFDRGVLSLSRAGWVHYTEKNGLPDDRIMDLVVDGSGDPWIITFSGKVARFSERSWEEVILPCRGGTETGSAAEEDYILYLDPAIRFLSGRDMGDRERTGSEALCLGLDGRGNCLVGTGDGIYRFTGSEWHVIDPPSVSTCFEPTSVAQTSRGSIWVGTARSGVFIYQRGEWLHIGISTGLSDDHILSICEDTRGRVWIGTRYGGVTRFVSRSVH